MALSIPRTYWQASQAPRYSLLFALPLLLFYETLAAALSVDAQGGVRNGADVLLKGVFAAALGPRGPLVFEATLIALGMWLVARDIRRHGGRLAPAVFGLMAVEAALLALACGVVVGGLTSRLLSPLRLMLGGAAGFDVWTRVMLSLGAGLYEELLFRVVLVGLLAWGARRLLGFRVVPAGVAAVVLGALVFSAFHYIGPYGDRLAVYSFVYRLVAGVFFSGLYLARGFGITAWTHALYDVIVLVLAPTSQETGT